MTNTLTPQHPHHDTASFVRHQLSNIPGVIACAVRAHADPPKSPQEIRDDAESAYDEMAAEGIGDDLGPKSEWVKEAARHRTEDMQKHLAAAPAPFPHFTDGPQELVHYLEGLTNLLAPSDDQRIDAKIEVKVGAVRFVAESWDEASDAPLLIAVAIPQNHSGVKSLMRILRRVRKKNRTPQKTP